ncbi:MAG TPA: aminotransferase class III-fold pyridoxal phosphate-dependent enzyme [Stellaceae bacterium]|nr:aminotransferase class III-fold pyridoxal phosphate-dependent enzyme [Stellaceae bacterium]
MSDTVSRRDEVDRALRARARAVIPGGMYGHQNAAWLPEGYPQFFASGRGCRIRDVDGNDYIDFMCSYGPIVLGHAHAEVDAAAARQQALGDCQNGPSARMVELAELLVDTVAHADWAMFQKNGTDAMSACVTIARAATGRRKILVAKGAYHGAAAWCTPVAAGIPAEARAHLIAYTYNDIASVERAVDEAGSDLAGIVASAFRHDARTDQALPDPTFAQRLRALCDKRDAALILDDVRAGFRLHLAGSWEALGVRPDLSAWSKAIANGYPLAAVLGGERFREGATKIFATGSFWFAATAMAAAIATINILRQGDAIPAMARAGALFRDGIAAQARSHGIPIRQSGPAQMPLILFDDDADFKKGALWTAEAMKRGVYLHPWHNMFLSAAHRDEDIREALEITDIAFAKLRRTYG